MHAISDDSNYHDESRQIDRALNALSDPHRRRLLMMINEKVQSDDDLPFHIETIRDQASIETNEIEIKLIHNDLPKLADLGYIKWDQADDAVSIGPRWDEVQPILFMIQQYRDELS